MPTARRRSGIPRGSAWLEILIALTLLLPLSLLLSALYRSGASLVAGAAHYGAARAQLAELSQRWENEAASAWAIFTPARDVLGQPNCSAGACREVDFFSRDPGRAAHFWAWRYDAEGHALQRYTYADPAAPAATLARSGPALSGITAFETHRVAASSLRAPALGGYVARDVSLNLGYPEVDGGNALTAIDVANAAGRVVREFLPATTPSGFEIVVGTFTPPPLQARGDAPAPLR